MSLLPPLDARGLLPQGVHQCTWTDIEQVFCDNAHRASRYERLQDFVRDELRAVASGLGLVLGGSFFSDKPHPGDIDCTCVIPANEIPNRTMLIVLATQHGAKGRIYVQYHVEFYPTLQVAGQSDFRSFFQYVGPKTAFAKSLKAKDRRGVVEVSPW